MKKIKLIALPLVAALSFGVAACSATEEDQAPEIKGVADKMCAVGAVYDLLEGVVALDKEDGDITPAMQITINGEEVDGYYTTFDDEDDYEVKYKVTDSNGHVAEETATISAIARDVYKKFDLVDFGGFEVKTAGAAKKGTESVIGNGADSIYTFKVTGAAADTDAVLTRTYSLKSGTNYTVTYYLKSNVAGTVKAKIADGDAVDVTLIEGDNEFTLNYSVPAGEKETTAVKIDILFGGLGADIEWGFDKVVTKYTDSTVYPYTELVGDDFTFAGYENRDGHASDAGLSADRKSAHVTTTGNYEIWQEGLFINTGITLDAKYDYKISFDLTTANPGNLEVCILRQQWGPDEFLKTLYNGDLNKNGRTTTEITNVPANKTNTLWLFIQSGTNANTITLSNLSVQQKQKNGYIYETHSCSNVFYMQAKDGAPNYVQWIDGKLVYEVEEFSAVDWHNKIQGPDFPVDIAGVEFIMSFKVKATAPVLVTWIGPVTGGWDPNLIWKQFTLSETEQVITFKGNESDSSIHHFEWQFGASVNQKYKNVKIEISDIAIYWPNGVLDN